MLNYWKNTHPGPKNQKKPFNKRTSFEKRLEESEKVRAKYPERLPVIVERHGNSLNIPEIDRNKYLVPDDLTFGQMVYVIRKRVQIPSDQAMYFFVNGSLMPFNKLIFEIYEKHKSEDGFLYLIYSGETTFG
jgi:GABA(A) receptor-associated protein